MFVCVCVSVCLSVYTITKKNGSIDLKLEHIVVYKNSSDEFDIWALSDQGQGHGVTEIFLHLPLYKL